MTGDQHHSNQQPLATASIELPPELPVGSWIEPAALPGSGDLLLVPVVEADGATLMPPLLAWVEQAASVPPTVLELYGTIVIWTPGRVAVASAADRLPRATAAVNEFTATVGELERLLASGPTMKPISPAALSLQLLMPVACLSSPSVTGSRCRWPDGWPGFPLAFTGR
ncbi:MAG: hypothetical protein EBZ13_11545, partial [Planctomycetia bacterium]|nr:hypothetical protein [Planctomycetia bacterium]